MPNNDNQLFKLEDIDVDTLGLVSQGANREDFFLTKSETNGEFIGAEPVSPSVIEEKITKNVWQRLIDLFKRQIVENYSEEESEPESKSMMENKESMMEDEEEKEDTETVKSDEQPIKLIKEQIVEEVKEETIKGEDTMSNDEVISKADFEKAQSEIAELKKALEDEKVEKAKMSWINKASVFGYVPISSKELGEHLYNLAKYDSKEADWLVDLLKSYDAMLEDSGLFMEKGTSAIETDTFEKVLKAENTKDALLAIPRKEAEAYLKDMRARSRG